MPRQRRRRRPSTARASRTNAPAAALDTPATSPSALHPIRPWWKPTLGVVLAFSLGLWLGGTASVAEVASGVALAVGAFGVAIACARLLRNRLYNNRVQALRERRAREERDLD